MTSIHDEFEGGGGDVVPLEPLSKPRGVGIGHIMRAIFDVFYEADAPLTVDEIAPRAFDKVAPAVHYKARRAYLRRLQRGRSSGANTFAPDDVPLQYAWRTHLVDLLRGGVRYGTLCREGDRYTLNPSKAPLLETTDGRRVRYTREVWSEMTTADRAIGDIQAMRMEADRVLADLDTDALRQAVALVSRNYLDQRVDERALRGRLLWLMERPGTDAGRAWLLTELVRRAYG